MSEHFGPETAHLPQQSVTPASRFDSYLFDQGTRTAEVDDWRRRVRRVIETHLVPMVAPAENERRFPSAALRLLAGEDLFRQRWVGAGHGDLGRAVILSEELGRAWLGGIGVGISVHLESVLSILRRFGNAQTNRHLELALDGQVVTCLGSSEVGAGSDLSAINTTLSRVSGGWRVRGQKAFVSLGRSAEVALILCRLAGDQERHDERLPPLAVVLVPSSGLQVEQHLNTMGMRSLETVRVTVDARVEDEALIGRPGRGLLTVTWGLSHERLASAAQILGAASRAIGLAVAHLRQRQQQGSTLFDRQALRLRIADLASRVELARRGLYEIAASHSGTLIDMTREVAGAKVTAARLGERVISECMHVLGGQGYVEDATPFARLYRDVRLARLGAGTDEMMWELVASGLRGDYEAYELLGGVAT